MMTRTLLLLTLALSFLTGCPPEGEGLADLTFDPPVDDRGNAVVDLGDVVVGTNPPPSATIIVTNNTDEEISVGVDCDTLAGTPFNISCPESLTIPPEGSEDASGSADNSRPIGGALLVGPNDVGSVTASIFFDHDNRVYAFTLLANVTQ